MLDPIFDKIEPEAKVDDTTFNAATSQAISLKRIADALEKLVAVPTMKELTPAQKEALTAEMLTSGQVVFKS